MPCPRDRTAKRVLGVKVVEYCSCGFPIIVHPYVGAAADLANFHGVGVVIDGSQEKEKSLASLRLLFDRINEVPELSSQVATKYFLLEAAAKAYLSRYESIIDN